MPVVVRRLSVGLQDPSSHASGPPGPFHDADVFGSFAAQLDKLWHLWEMILLGKPLMIYGPSPTDCSWATAALLSLIAPIPYAYDFRPYYTIHDSAFALLAKGVLPEDPPHLNTPPFSASFHPRAVSEADSSSHNGSRAAAWGEHAPVDGGHSTSGGAAAGNTSKHVAEGSEEGDGFERGLRGVPCLFGVTNLFFVKALPHWPSILAIDGRNSGNIWATSGKEKNGAQTGGASSFGGAVKAIRARSQGSQALLSGHIEALWSQYRPLTRPDHKLLARLLQPKPGDIKSKVTRIAFVNNGAIHRHFHDLTTGLLQPLQRFTEPGPDGWLPLWEPAAFLQGLRATQAAGVPAVVQERVGGTSAIVELYSRLFASANFRTWLAMHRQTYAHLLPPPSKPLTSVTSDTYFNSADEGEDVLVVAAGAPGAQGHAAGSRRVGGEAWFAHAREHMDEVEFINLFFTQEQLLREAQAAVRGEIAPPNSEDLVARLRSELVNLLLGINQRDLQLICISAPQRRELLRDCMAHGACNDNQRQVIEDLCAELD